MKKINYENIASWFFILVAACFCFVVFRTNFVSSKKTVPEYAEKVFGKEIMSVEIFADEKSWQEMLNNAENEEYICVDVAINGQMFYNVAIRPKGNSSLKQVASSESDRFSFRIKFDKYVKGQTCFGLDTMVLNNMLDDNSYIQEYLSYDIMKTAGVETPYFCFSDISVNGKNWGLYLAIEMYNDSYLTRQFGDTSGNLYNVKMIGDNHFGSRDSNKIPPFTRENFEGELKNGNFSNDFSGDSLKNFAGNSSENFSENFAANSFENFPQNSSRDFPKNFPGDFDGGFPPDFPEDFEPQNNSEGFDQRPQLLNQDDKKNFKPGGLSGDKAGGSLVYTDDKIESYASIFDNSVGNLNKNSAKKVINALKILNQGSFEQIENIFDVDSILKYLAAHTFVVNFDSYSSNMAQNYYICEYNGVVSVLPWDYNQSWGGFHVSESEAINFPIDTPVSTDTTMEDRPLISKLLSNEEYKAKYHGHLQKIVDEYFANGQFTSKVAHLKQLISSYVEKDSTKFCTYQEYISAIDQIEKLGNLRAESVSKQLNGDVPSTREEQEKNPQLLISSDDIKLSSSMMKMPKMENSRRRRNE